MRDEQGIGTLFRVRLFTRLLRLDTKGLQRRETLLAFQRRRTALCFLERMSREGRNHAEIHRGENDCGDDHEIASEPAQHDAVGNYQTGHNSPPPPPKSNRISLAPREKIESGKCGIIGPR